MAAGACTYTELTGGRLTMRDVFEMLMIVDWNNYAQARAYALAKAEQG